MYLLNFSPKASGLLMSVLYPRGGGAPIGRGCTYRLFLVPHSHELHVCFVPWSPLSSSLFWCPAFCAVSVCGSCCPRKSDLKYVGLN